MSETITIVFAGILVLTLLCQWFSWWIRLPSILFLLITGLVIGPLTGWLNPNAIFGNTLEPFIALSVAIILFEGSLSLNFREIKPHLSAVSRLLSIGVAITSIGAALTMHYLFHVSYQLALLFGVIVSVSGPTTITPLLRAIRPTEHVSNILRWEGIIIDPIGALLAVLVFNFIYIYNVGGAVGHTLLTFVGHIVVGMMTGIVLGYLTGVALRRHWLPEYLHNVATLSLVIFAYTIANHFDSGSGLLAVTLMGVLMANMQDVHIDDIVDFKESLSILLISGVFIMLAAQINFTNMHNVFDSAILLIAILQFVIRPLNIFICTFGTALTWQEKTLLAWIAPRGIVAAAISAIFALQLHQINVPGSHLLVVLTFLVVIGTVVFQSLTAPLLARWLGLMRTNNTGFLIIGANPVARAIGAALQKYGVKVMLVSVIWDNIQAARMEGLPTFYGHPVSDKTDRQLDLVGLDHLLTLTSRNDLNTLSIMRYRREFGAKNILSIKTNNSEKNKTSITAYKPQTLFGSDIMFSQLLNLFSRNAEIKHTKLSDEFNFEHYQQQYANALLLIVVDTKNNIQFYTSEQTPLPKKDWTIVSLV